MLKKQGIEILLFLLTITFLFTSEALFLNHILAAELISQTKSQSATPAQTDQSYQSQSNVPSSLNANASPVTPSAPHSQAILETSYKKYSLFKHGDSYILCEPYTVQNGDWIYKIFRSKGEISKKDFGLFLKIFKEINPGIHDMNTIKQGQCITIPLKKSSTNDFKESKPGVVEVPIITLSQLPDKLRRGTKTKTEPDTVMTNSNGTSLQDSLSSAITDKEKQSTSVMATLAQPSSQLIPIRQLKQLAMINNGQLLMKGKYYFPRNDEEDLVIDVAVNPLMHFQNGSRILFVPEKEAFDRFTNTIRTFWKSFKIMEFDEVETSLDNPLFEDISLNKRYLNYHHQDEISLEQYDLERQSVTDLRETIYIPINETIPYDHKAAVKKLLQLTGYKYKPEKEISFSVGNISIKTTQGLISRDGKPDILLVFGDIYGSAFESLKKNSNSEILTISPLLKVMDVVQKLFSALGESVTQKPSFVNAASGQTITIDGVYIKNDHKEVFITEKPMLKDEIFTYLTEKHITILRIDNQL